MASLSSASEAVRRSRARFCEHAIVRALALGATYAALSVLIVIVTAFGNASGATFWPGAGLTVATLLLRPKREWPYYIAAFAIAEAGVDLWAGYSVALAVGWAVANTAEPLVSALLLRRRGAGAPDFSKRADLARFVVAAIVIGPLVGALIGTAVGVAFEGDPWWPRLPRWYVGDAIGVLVIAPALLILWPPGVPSTRRGMMPSLLILTIVTCAALGPWRFAAATGLPFLILPVLTVIALRFGLRGAAGGVLIVATIIEAVTASGHGPFADDAGGAFHGLVVAQMFLAMCAVTTYVVAVLAGELTTGAKLEHELRAQAGRDSLTGLANRRLLFDRIEQASRRLARRPGVVALIFIDLDAFKAVNDSFGHAVGDHILVQSADRLSQIVRDEDSVSRIGGDEFLILAEDLRDVTDAHDLAARVVHAFDEPFESAAGPLQLTASVGIATITEPITDPEAYLSGADRAMYSAKRAGGDRIAAA